MVMRIIVLLWILIIPPNFFKLVTIPRGYVSTYNSILAWHLLPEVFCVYIPASSWVVLVWAMYQGIHQNIYIIWYVVMPCSSHPHLVSVKLLLLEGPYYHTIYFTEIK